MAAIPEELRDVRARASRLVVAPRGQGGSERVEHAAAAEHGPSVARLGEATQDETEPTEGHERLLERQVGDSLAEGRHADGRTSGSEMNDRRTAVRKGAVCAG